MEMPYVVVFISVKTASLKPPKSTMASLRCLVMQTIEKDKTSVLAEVSYLSVCSDVSVETALFGQLKVGWKRWGRQFRLKSR